MAVQQEIKSQLAKLLATEDLVVEHKSVHTAQFNVHTRVSVLNCAVSTCLCSTTISSVASNFASWDLISC